MPKKILKYVYYHQPKAKSGTQMGGFILLEVLVAMGLVLAGWIGSVNAYHIVLLRMGQEVQKRVQIHRELDEHEIKQSQRGINESTGVPRRNGPVARSSSSARKK